MLVTLSQNWWATLVRGLIAIGLGLFAWVLPDLFWASLVVVAGAYLLIDGIFAIAAALRGQTDDRWLHLLEGIVGIGAGAIIFLYPDLAGTAIVLVIGIWAMVTGVLEVVAAVRLRQEIENEWLLGIGGVISIGLGVLLVFQPQSGWVTTTYVLGTYGILFGVLLVALALRLRRLEPGTAA